MQHSPALQAALDYAARGFSVLPLRLGGKKPITPNGYKDATTDEKIIIDWWTAAPNANIGIATGRVSGFFVVDVDGENLGKFKELLPKLITVKSFRGCHYYFKYPDNCSIKSRSKLHGLDVDIKSDGGYIVAPPSLHPRGVFYQMYSEEVYEASQELLEFISQNNDAQVLDAGFPNSAFREEHIEEMLSVLDPDMDYEDWCKVGMAIYHDNRNSDLWSNWSSKGKKFKKGECEKKWTSFSSDRDTKISIGTLVSMAQKQGYISPYEKDKTEIEFPNNNLPQRQPIKLYNWSELDQLPRKKVLIKNLINQGDMSVLFGKSNAGKTFLALDIALHISLGWLWQGKKVCEGAVVYIAAESGLGIRDRLKAFKQQHNLENFPNFYIIPETVLLGKEGSMLDELRECLKGLNDIQLIVVDTLARSMGGSDENSSSDMGAFINNCGVLQSETGAHVMAVHHPGKDFSRGARGHSSLNAAIDTEIQVSQKDGIITVEITKQRDGKTGDQFCFKLNEQMLYMDDDGDFITSCALINADAATNSLDSELSDQTYGAYVLLQKLIDREAIDIEMQGGGYKECISIERFKAVFEESALVLSDIQDSIRKAFTRVKNSLLRGGYISEARGYIWLSDKPDMVGQTINNTRTDRTTP